MSDPIPEHITHVAGCDCGSGALDYHRVRSAYDTADVATCSIFSLPPAEALASHLADLIKGLPPVRDTDPARVEVGRQAWVSLLLAFETRTGPDPAYSPFFGLPVIVRDDLDPHVMRLISRGGDVLNETRI